MDEVVYALEESDERYKHGHLSAGQKAALAVGGGAVATAAAIFFKKHFDRKLMEELEEFPGLKAEVDSLKREILSGGIRKGTTLRHIKAIRAKLDKAEASGLLHKSTIRRTRKLLDKLEVHTRSQKTTFFKNPFHSYMDKHAPLTDRLA